MSSRGLSMMNTRNHLKYKIHAMSIMRRFLKKGRAVITCYFQELRLKRIGITITVSNKAITIPY